MTTNGRADQIQREIQSFKQQYANRSLCELGVLLQRVDELREEYKGMSSPDPHYQKYIDRERARLVYERIAITNLIDAERRSGPRSEKPRGVIREIVEALLPLVASGEAYKYDSRAQLLNRIDLERFPPRQKRTTYRELNREFGTSLPQDVREFVKFMLEQT